MVASTWGLIESRPGGMSLGLVAAASEVLAAGDLAWEGWDGVDEKRRS